MTKVKIMSSFTWNFSKKGENIEDQFKGLVEEYICKSYLKNEEERFQKTSELIEKSNFFWNSELFFKILHETGTEK